MDPTPATTVVHVDSTPPRAEITEPGDGDAVLGVVLVQGSAWDETDFEGYIPKVNFDPMGRAVLSFDEDPLAS